MEPWIKTTSLLCLFGFLKDFKPSEPFLTQYLIEPKYANITLEEAYESVYPVWTYSYLFVLIFVFLLTDYVKYKPMIVFEGLAYIATWLLLVFGRGVQQMQLMQFTYGIATSTEIAYYAYIYAQVNQEQYQKVTSFTRVATLTGIFFSSVFGQVCITWGLLDYRQLNIIALGSVSIAALVSLSLPKANKSIYFHSSQNEAAAPESEMPSKFRQAFAKLKLNVVASFRQKAVFKWSLWWSLGMCGNYQVGNYIQPLWQAIKDGDPGSGDLEVWNGAVEAISTLGGAVLAFAFAYIKLNWALVGELLLIVISMLDGILLILMGTCNNVWMAYAGYLMYRPLFQMLITIASFEIARQIKLDSCGVVFGVNTFMALTFQTILTWIVVEWLQLEPSKQFVVYGGYCIAVGVLFVFISIITCFFGGGNVSQDFLQRLKKEGIHKKTKKGEEDDVESRQLSLGGAVEATK